MDDEYVVKLILIRGIPGSGKSTLAKEYADKGYCHYEADQYFINDKGVYEYKDLEGMVAHAFCQHKAFIAMDNGYNVVVANTFLKTQWMLPYIRYAQPLGIKWKIIECTGKYDSIHNVPQDAMERMKMHYESMELVDLMLLNEPGRVI
jgi:predicted kinase